jgi:transcriptional regulator with XRE-family HTH domain
MISSFASYDMPKRQPKQKRDVPPGQGPALEARRKQLKMTQPELGFLINVSQPSISEYERNVRPVTELTMDRLTAYATGLKWSVSQLLEATGMKSDSSTQFFAPGLTSPKVLDADNPLHFSKAGGEFRMVKNIAHATRPQSSTDQQPNTGSTFVKTEHLRPGLEVWEAHGLSMASGKDGIEHGDILYIDTHDLKPVENKIYVFHVPGDGYCVKRLLKLGTEFWLKSDHPDHESFKTDDVEIIGRVFQIISARSA